MDICGGGTVNAGVTSISFTNHHDVQCTITSCDMPGWPTTDPVIPKKEGSTPGTGTVQLSQPATVGSYTYTPDCCPQGGAPVIKVQ
jgi:hypothetical protein